MSRRTEDEQAMDRLISKVLTQNQLQLFDADGSDRSLDANRHLDSFVSRRRRRAFRQAVLLQATVDLFGSWALHLRKSFYKRPWYGGVTVYPAWLQEGSAEPPAALVRNSPIAVGPVTDGGDDLGFAWRYATSLGSLAVRRLGPVDDWIYWICLADPPY